MAKTYVDSLTNRTAALNGSASSDGLFTWANKDGGNTAATVSAVGLGGTGNSAYGTSADTDTDDMYVEVTLAGANFGDVVFWFDLLQSGTYPGGTGYEAAFFGGAVNLFRINGGAFNAMNTGSHTLQAGTYRFEYTRSTGAMAVKFNGSTIVTDTNTSEPAGSGNRKVVLGFDVTATGVATFTNFGYGDIGGGGGGGGGPQESPMQHGGLRQVMVQ